MCEGHDHEHGHEHHHEHVDVGPDLKGQGKYKVSVFSEADGASFGEFNDLNQAIDAFKHALSHAVNSHKLDGKMREVSVIVGMPAPMEKYIICPECGASGADIELELPIGDAVTGKRQSIVEASFGLATTEAESPAKSVVDWKAAHKKCRCSCGFQFFVTKEEYEAEEAIRRAHGK